MIRTNKMYKLLDTDTDEKTATVEAGCILINFLEQIADFGMALHDIPEGVRQTVAGAMSTGTHGSHHQKGIFIGSDSGNDGCDV